MKEINVEVCVCTECVMNGAMDLIESAESLKKVKNRLEIEAQINVEMNKCVGGQKHGEGSPMASVNGEILEKADSETLMEKIIEAAK